MNWTKASERLPETSDNYYVIVHGDGKGVYFFNGKRFEVGEWVNINSIQWLDESPIKEDGEQDEYKFPVTVNEVCDVIQNTCQLLMGIKPDAINENWWSDWDESVLVSLINILKKIQPHYRKIPNQ